MRKEQKDTEFCGYFRALATFISGERQPITIKDVTNNVEKT